VKFATNHIRHYPFYLRRVATLPGEIKNLNFLQIWNEMQTNFDIFVTKSSKLETFLRHSVDCDLVTRCNCLTL